MKLTWLQALVAIGGLALVHGLLFVLPGPGLKPTVNLVLYATNIYVLYCASSVLRERSGRALAGFIAGYAALFGLLMVWLDRKPLFILLIILYASVFRSAFLLGAFAVFVLSFVVLQPFAFETFLPLAFAYAVLWRARRSDRFTWLCLAFGLLGLAVILLPLFHLVLQDSAQTVWLTFTRPDVREALWISILASSLATACLIVWGVPLAYALARTDFRGKRIVETIIDVPILIPQSVVGIALMVFLGPGSVLGAALEARLGVQFSGRLAGLVVAQVFVAAPFLVKTAMAAFEAVPLRLEHASRTLGASATRTFFRISLPLASRGVLIGVALAWARAISEFGSVILFSASPVSAPVLVHTEFLRAGASESRPIATALLLTCVWVFIVLQFGQTLLPFSLRRAAGKSPP